MKNKKEKIIAILLVVGLIVATGSISYAAFRFSGIGSKVNTITTGAVTMSYTESSNVLNMSGALPTTDTTGKGRLNPGEYFDFTVSSSITGDTNINYEIAVEELSGSTMDGDYINFYLTKVNTDGSETEVMSPSIYKEETVVNAYTGRPANMMSLYTGSMSVRETTTYRLRMYVSEEYNPQGDGGNLEYKARVNVYGLAGDVPLEGDGQSFHKLAPSTLTFRSSAPLSEFQEVQIDGVTLDPSCYTKTEGSTIITLSIDYLQTLDVKEHEITVVSESGSPSANFEVIEPALNEHGFYYNQPYTAYVPALGCDFAVFVRKDGTFDAIAYGDGSGVETCTYTVGGGNMNMNTSMGTLHGTLSSDGKEISCAEFGVTLKLGEESITADENYIYIYEDLGNDDLDGYYVMAFDKTKSSYGSIRSNIYGSPVVQIGSYAFRDCVNLENFVVPNGITFLSNDAFGDCTSLESITIPSSLLTLNKYAFSGCSNLSNITFKGTIEQWNSISKGSEWDTDIPATQVKCSDGVVPLQ